MNYQNPEEVPAGQKAANPSGPARPSRWTRQSPISLTRPQWDYCMPSLFSVFFFWGNSPISWSSEDISTEALCFSLWGPRFHLSSLHPATSSQPQPVTGSLPPLCGIDQPGRGYQVPQTPGTFPATCPKCCYLRGPHLHTWCPISGKPEPWGLESSFSFSPSLETHQGQSVLGDAALQFCKLLPYLFFHSCSLRRSHCS